MKEREANYKGLTDVIMGTEPHQDRNLGKSWFCYIDPEFSKTAVETFLFYACHIILLIDNTATLSTGFSSMGLD